MNAKQREQQQAQQRNNNHVNHQNSKSRQNPVKVKSERGESETQRRRYS